MKKLLLLSAFVFPLFLVTAQNRETRNVDTFTKISFGVSGTAYVKQGPVQKVELEGSRDALDKIEAIVKDDKLIIRSKDSWNWSWGKELHVTVYITAKDIRALSVSGSGDMEAQTKIVTGDLDLKVSGSGNLRAEIEANNVEASVSGSGNIRLRGKCNNLKSHLSGSGDVEAEIMVADRLDISISGSGKMVASGKANTVKANISGSGRVRAGDLEANVCDVKIGGSGSVEINVKSELNATISGSGSVNYKGSPSHVNANSSGSGKVRKM